MSPLPSLLGGVVLGFFGFFLLGLGFLVFFFFVGGLGVGGGGVFWVCFTERAT